MKNLHLLPTDKPKQETLKELALKNSKYINHSNINYSKQEAIILDAKWMQERMYSEKEVILLLQRYRLALSASPDFGDTTKSWFKKFKKK